MIDENEIISFLKKGAKTTSDIQRLTGAGTSCGRCLPVIDEIVATFNSGKPEEQQKKLDFG